MSKEEKEKRREDCAKQEEDEVEIIKKRLCDCRKYEEEI